ncbi:scramblase [Archangium violaceum]|uniref:phospholipid scramblase-related protein n=1 Tax=Archangium violaceum TaxID=83451 RepID=UPI001951CE67|nr:phospholipid scramblase-related protein [Archangium violaceum]QRN93983.1 scramblase [Archangium violaceum]
MGQENGRPRRDDELELDWKGRTAPEERVQQTALAEAGAGRGAPGDPRYMGLELRSVLGPVIEGPGLSIRQIKEWAEILVGWETRNRYEAIDADGRFMLYIGETGEGWGNALLRNLWPFRRVELECMTQGGTRALSIHQPWTFFFTYVEVTAWDGRQLGYIQQRFGVLRRTFDLCTPAGVVMATLEGPLWKPWTFHVKQRGQEVATIRKQWSGLGKEVFSDADNFGVEFHSGLTDARLRQMVLAATLMVDLCYFEERNRSGSFWDFLGFFD